jgi:hypothetical protein
MVALMYAGMIALDRSTGGLPRLLGSTEPATDWPIVSAIVMTVEMTVPMIPFMRWHGHSRRHIVEMAGAMASPCLLAAACTRPVSSRPRQSPGSDTSRWCRRWSPRCCTDAATTPPSPPARSQAPARLWRLGFASTSSGTTICGLLLAAPPAGLLLTSWRHQLLPSLASKRRGRRLQRPPLADGLSAVAGSAVLAVWL